MGYQQILRIAFTYFLKSYKMKLGWEDSTHKRLSIGVTLPALWFVVK